MKKLFQNTIRTVRVLVVTAMAQRVYRQAVGKADHKRIESGRQTFVITDPRDGRALLVITDREFRRLRHLLNIRSADATVAAMKSGCWYHTVNMRGKDGMSARRKEIARKAFVKDSLEASGLIA